MSDQILARLNQDTKRERGKGRGQTKSRGKREIQKHFFPQTSHPELRSGTENLCTGGDRSWAGRLPGPHWSQLKQRQPMGFQLGGKAAFCAKLAGASSLKFQPSPTRPKAQVSSVLWQRWNEGLPRGWGGGCGGVIASCHSLSRNRGKQVRKEVRGRQEEVQTVFSEGCKNREQSVS